MARTTRRVYTVGDLKHVPPGTVQYCLECSQTYSATHGDYFMRSDDTPLRCCGRPVRLVIRRTVYEEVQVP